MDYLSHNIGSNLSRIRKSKGYSLDLVAEQTGVSKSMLAQIEKGNANPSVGVLGKIVSGLRIDFNDLIQTPFLDSYLVDVKQTLPTKELDGMYQVWTCFPIADNNRMEVYRIDIEPGGVYISGGHGERTREYICVLDGELTMVLSNGEHIINKEHIFRFEADKEHRYCNCKEEKLRFVSFFVTYAEK